MPSNCLRLLLTKVQTLLYTQTMEISPVPGNINKRSSSDRLWDWRAVLLTIAVVCIASKRLADTNWTPLLYFVQTMGFIGVVLGLLLGYSNFPRRIVVYLSAGYTVLLIPAQLLKVIDRTDWLWQDISTLFDRLFISLDLFIRNQPVLDPLFFTSIVMLVFWGIGLSAGYWVIRHRAFLGVVLPSGLAILIVQAFDSAESRHIWEVALFIFVCMLLLGRIYFLQNRSYWKKANFLLTDEAINDLERGVLAITAIIVFISWSFPSWVRNIKPAAQKWQDFSQPIFDRYSNAVSALDSPYAEKSSSNDFYGASLALGQQAATSNTPIFTVKVNENTFAPVRHYWKGRTYDLYFNGQWETTSNTKDTFVPAIDELTVEYPNDRHKMEYTFTSSTKKQSLLYAPAETIWVSTKSNIVSTPISAGLKDVTSWVATTSLLNGGQYKVRALIANPSIEELRTTTPEYPAWISDRYLQIPEDIAPQLNKLATEITAPYDTVYDKVQAITVYLRKEIEYSTTITDTPPENKDPVLWVLLDTKKGFCMYYASAETLLLRSIGIPARMAVGFVEGNFDELEGEYAVTYKDSHAWPEVYFSGIGWVEFEPTSSQFPIERPETKKIADIATTPSQNALEGTKANPGENTPSKEIPEATANDSLVSSRTKLYENALIFALTFLTLGFGIFITHRYSLIERLPLYLAGRYEGHGNLPPRWLNWWIRWTKLSPIEHAFQTINLSLIWLGHPQPAHITSHERAETLIKYLPSAQDQVWSLLHEYHLTTYTPHPGNLSLARKTAIIIILKTWQIRIMQTLKFPDTHYNQSK
jgi:transglutaminase-like putative cysteine protease